jgi:endonuclease/exonuclease/phosphatase family metal-dependent hydrolase
MNRDAETHGGTLLTVMTQNLYLGAELAPIFIARSREDMVVAAATAWEKVQASEIKERAERVAEVIVAEAPDLVALQEAARWSVGSTFAMTVKYDFLSSILQAIHDAGAFYVPVAVNQNLDETAPIDMAGNQVRIVDRDAVLLKIDDTAMQVRPFNIQSESFATLMPVTSPVLGVIKVPRGWIAIDATIDKQKFRLINTHLESYDARVQMAQASELISGPGNTGLPTVIAGDFNSNANQKANDAAAIENTQTYGHLIAGGFRDVWASVNPGDSGNTCCQHPDLTNDASALFERIDLVITRAGFTPVAAKLVADRPSSRTFAGRWPSDHAGIFTELKID